MAISLPISPPIPAEFFVAQVFQDVACTVCGCVCDDLTLHVDGERIVAAERACSLSEPWLLGQTAAHDSPVRIDGAPATFDAAVRQAATILARSQAPLVYGLSTSSTPGQRAAVRLAETLGATVDTTASTCHAPSILAVQSVGESTASLGEVKNRADLVIYWGSDPLVSHPRHVERYVDANGLFVPRGRSDRYLVVVDVQRTATAELADRFVQVEHGGDFELLWALRAAVKGVELPIDSAGGVPLDEIHALAERFRACRYGAVFFGLGITKGSVPHANVEALLQLVTDLNAHTRFIARRMRVPGDVAGADSVLCWQTGFPFSVNFTRGYPRYSPGEYTANTLLERCEVDAVVLVGTEGVAKLSEVARQTLARLPVITLDSPLENYPLPAAVSFTTAVYGVHRPGTAYRMDEVPIPLRGVLDSPLASDAEVLAAINQKCMRER